MRAMSDDAQVTESGRIYAGESAAERQARQRRQFMEAGLELFGTVGYRATSVRALCKQAGLIDRYFYKNFADTEELLAAVYTESLDQLERQVVQSIGTRLRAGEAQGIVEAGLDTFFAAFENSRMARVCWLEVLGVSPRIDALYSRRIEQFAALLLSVARQLLPSWSRSPEESKIISVALVGAISQSAAHWLLSGYRADRRILVSANTLLLQGLVTALSASEGEPGKAAD
jgi:AcrR family transcriptional regulator